MNLIPRSEHPRPTAQRKDWQSLNGSWDFYFSPISLLDRERKHIEEKIPEEFPLKIHVPFAHQSGLSGLIGPDGTLGDLRNCETVWYRRSFEIPKQWQGKRVLLHFGAVDYEASVWLNGQFLGQHRGGHVPFCFDLGVNLGLLRSDALKRYKAGECELVLKAFDPLDPAIPRGKQGWESPMACWYTQSTGIWQSVWLEAVSEIFIKKAHYQCTLVDQAQLDFSVQLSAPMASIEGACLEVILARNGQEVARKSMSPSFPETRLSLLVADPLLWSPENPELYGLCYRLLDDSGELVDELSSYVGLRTVALSRKGLLLNGKPYYQRLVLDQGFWPDGRYTAPTDEALKRDIELAKEAGFNGCRKHMKIEDPRFLYWADHLGFLVWGEFPAPYVFTHEAQNNFLSEWLEAVERDRSQPCIVAWTLYNESWGIGAVRKDPVQQAWLRKVYQLTRSIDPSRPVIDNDGWGHVISDIYTCHTYDHEQKALKQFYENVVVKGQSHIAEEIQFPKGGIPMMVNSHIMPDMPVLISEFGGVGFVLGRKMAAAWAYDDIPENEQAFKERFEGIMQTIYSFKDLCGFCYTQLTDVDQEINGVLTFDRRPKFDLSYFKEWFGKPNSTFEGECS